MELDPSVPQFFPDNCKIDAEFGDDVYEIFTGAFKTTSKDTQQ